MVENVFAEDLRARNCGLDRVSALIEKLALPKTSYGPSSEGSHEFTPSELREHFEDLIEELGHDFVDYIMVTYNLGQFDADLLHLYELDSFFRRRVDKDYR